MITFSISRITSSWLAVLVRRTSKYVSLRSSAISCTSSSYKMFNCLYGQASAHPRSVLGDSSLSNMFEGGRVVRERGFVSLFTCIMISLLLLVITVSMVSLEVLQLRKAQDAEQSLRAYYAAEAGVEDAVSQVLRQAIRPGVGDNICHDESGYDIPGAAGWTCQYVSFSGTPFGKLTSDQARTVDPGDVNYQSVLLEWDQSTDTNAARYNVNLAAGFPSDAVYKASYAAAPIELAIVEYPSGGFRADDANLKLQNMVVVPGGGAASGDINYNDANFARNSPYRGNCVPNRTTGFRGNATSYRCYALIRGFVGGNNFIFRIRSRYIASSFKMTFYSGNNGTGSVVQIPDGTATIDVTAKAGQTYRRVISKLPLNAGAAAGLNFVMYSDRNICKNFSVIDNVFPPVPGC